MPLQVTFEEIFNFEKIINVDSFILNNRIVYLLRIPIISPNLFEYYHLYSLPIRHQSLFRVVIPRSKYLIKNQWHYIHREDPCKEVKPGTFLCDKDDLKDLGVHNSCAVGLLETPKIINSTLCPQVDISLTKSIVNQLDQSFDWIVVLPQEEMVQLSCHQQKEVRRLSGSFLLNLPSRCNFKVAHLSITNFQKVIDVDKQPIIFPDFQSVSTEVPILNLSLHLQDIKLDELQSFRNRIESIPDYSSYPEFSRTPSLWTVFIYVLIAIFCTYLLFIYRTKIYCLKKKEEEAISSSPPIQLPF
ncbi:uncharacterized protein LOC126738180 [Anthonomus grandis grandis]|uniref:uncharacterized protein LOC126738180 n=1 Tax=Anthonomus grandis grandis TaxID=2921223 RepID=UPI0021669B36|nr:uncharacterized protein LOC126738180 [Anthonomus grandis grandis]XP_050299342.1 uncharacterized protein LOC126738180 [Anthonomus grandis grandis]XP_050299343.1 uncharacterized protein LOC126738180 [Anthonomus grandis grandis]